MKRYHADYYAEIERLTKELEEARLQVAAAYEAAEKALRELVTACEAYPVNIAHADAAWDNAHAALRALKGDA